MLKWCNVCQTRLYKFTLVMAFTEVVGMCKELLDIFRKIWNLEVSVCIKLVTVKTGLVAILSIVSLNYRTSVVLLMHPFVPEIMHEGAPEVSFHQ